MGLIVPGGPSWAYCTHNLPSSINAEALGATVTSGTSNADGSAVDIFGAALTHDVEYLRIFLNGELPAGGNNDMLATILIDPAGGTSWQTLIPYLICGGINDIGVSGGNPAGQSCVYDFPVWIPAGATVGVQIRSAHTVASTVYVAAFAHGGNANPASWWCGQRVTAIGINASSSTGTSHSPGASGSFSSWANFGSVLSADCGALQFCVSGTGSSFYFGAYYQFDFGVAAQRIGPPLFRILTTNEAGWWMSTGPIFHRLPAGAQLQVRGTCNISGQALGVAAWAVH